MADKEKVKKTGIAALKFLGAIASLWAVEYAAPIHVVIQVLSQLLGG